MSKRISGKPHSNRPTRNGTRLPGHLTACDGFSDQTLTTRHDTAILSHRRVDPDARMKGVPDPYLCSSLSWSLFEEGRRKRLDCLRPMRAVAKGGDPGRPGPVRRRPVFIQFSHGPA